LVTLASVGSTSTTTRVITTVIFFTQMSAIGNTAQKLKDSLQLQQNNSTQQNGFVNRPNI
jgi:hypothetical protein